MAERESRKNAEQVEADRFARERRRSPLVGQIVLAIGFLVILVISIFTVLLPEIQDDSEEEEQGSSAPAEDAPEESPDEAPAEATASPEE